MFAFAGIADAPTPSVTKENIAIARDIVTSVVLRFQRTLDVRSSNAETPRHGRLFPTAMRQAVAAGGESVRRRCALGKRSVGKPEVHHVNLESLRGASSLSPAALVTWNKIEDARVYPSNSARSGLHRQVARPRKSAKGQKQTSCAGPRHVCFTLNSDDLDRRPKCPRRANSRYLRAKQVTSELGRQRRLLCRPDR